MKNLKSVVLILLVSTFSLQQVNAQKTQSVNVEQKIKMQDAPTKVREALKDYSRYKISPEGTFYRKNNSKIYTFKIVKGKWAKYLLINEKGKILGTKSSEG